MGLGAVLVQELEELDSGGLVKGLRELVQARGDLQAGLEDAALALDAHVLGPLDVAAEVNLGANSAT